MYSNRTEQPAAMKRTRPALLAVAAAMLMGTVPAQADDVPKLDVTASCRAASRAFQSGRDNSACLADEQRARDALASQWSKYSAESRKRCTQMINDIPGTQSYVELLSCVEMAKDVQELPKNMD